MSAWTSVKTFTSTILTAADMNTYVSDNTNYLKDILDTAPRMLDRLTTAASFTNDSAEKTMYSYSVPGGTLGTNKVLHMSALGEFFNNNANMTFTIKVKFGSTTILNAVYTTVNVGATTQPIAIDAEIFAFAATNAQRSKVILNFDGTASGGVSGISVAKDFVGGTGGSQLLAGGVVSYCTHNALAEDSTAAKSLVITFTAGTANPNVTEKLHCAYTEVK